MQLPDQSSQCADFNEWTKGLNAESATLVFSSSYPNNPASMFGHTLLRLNPPKGAHAKPDLLAYAVNFSADIQGEANPISYAFRGLFGDFMGFFQIVPYYQMVNAYNHSESRDLWEYDLKLSPEQMAMMVDHVWELHNKAALDYFFLDENCSYHLLSILEVANPNWNLVKEFFSYHRLHYVMPATTVLAVTRQKDAVKDVHFRPSSRKFLQQQYQMLNADERREVRAALKNKKPIEEISSVYTLNTLAAYYDYRRYKDGDSLKPELKSGLRRTLLQRAKFQEPPTRAVPEFDKGNRPDLIHSPHLFRVFNGWNQQGHYIGLGLLQGVHDLLSPNAGYEPNSHLEVLDFHASYYTQENMTDKKLVFTRATIIDILSLDLLSSFDPEKSYRFYMAYEPGLNSSPLEANEFTMRGGVGLSGNWRKKNIFYLMALAAAGANPDVYRGYYLGPGAEVGWVATLTQKWKMNLTGLWLAPMAPSTTKEDLFQTYEWGQSWSLSRDFELRTKWAARPEQNNSYQLKHDFSVHAFMHF